MLKDKKNLLWTEISNMDAEELAGGRIDFRRVVFDFPPTKGRVQTPSETVVFNSHVNWAIPVVSGFALRFSDSDHEIGEEVLEFYVSKYDGNAVKIGSKALLRDWSGKIDDNYSGWAVVHVIADVV